MTGTVAVLVLSAVRVAVTVVVPVEVAVMRPDAEIVTLPEGLEE